MIQCPCQVRCFRSIKGSPLNFLNMCGAVSSQTVLQALLVIAALSTAALSLRKHTSVSTPSDHCGAVSSQTVLQALQALLVIAALSTATLSLRKHTSVRTPSDHCGAQDSVSI